WRARSGLDRCRRASDRDRHQDRQRLHLRPRRLRPCPPVEALLRGRRRLFRRGYSHSHGYGDCRMSSSLRLPYLTTAAVSGALFGAGLYVSQMVDPLKVLRFLDFGAIPSGGWDPSLAFVIGPAILVMFVAVRLSRKRQVPLFNGRFHEPEFTRIDTPLV